MKKTFLNHLPFLVLLIINLIIGIIVVKDYGISIDEPQYYEYAQLSLKAYKGMTDPTYTPFFGRGNLRFYGPSFMMGANLFAGFLQARISGWQQSDFFHLSYFLAYLTTVLCLYLISIRWFSRSTSLSLTMFFLFQPVLWGHAFINPKDIPFAMLFTASIITGLWLSDSLDLGQHNQHTIMLFGHMLVKSTSEKIEKILFLLKLLLAGTLLGLATSTRILGPWAGILISIYIVLKHQKKAWLPLILYFVVAVASLYITWPFLWENPILNFWKSIKIMSQFPWDGKVLFNGINYFPDELPRSYLPTLFSIQFTEPFVLLFILSVVVFYLAIKQRKISGEQALLLIGWLAVPMGGIIVSRRPLYDNFRQVLFLIPPMFLLIGFGIDAIYQRLHSKIVQGTVLLLLILPGLLNIISLHPYEYIYYNSFAGGVSGAFRKFEMDYWRTSTAESIKYLNATAPLGASIALDKFAQLAGPFARPDLQVSVPKSDLQNNHEPAFDFIIITTRGNMDIRLYPDLEVIHTVRRQGALLSVIKKAPSHK